MYQALWLGDNHSGRVIETLDLQFSGKVKAHSVRLDNMLGRLLVRPSTEHASASSEASVAKEQNLWYLGYRFIGRAANNFPFLPKNNVIDKKKSTNTTSFLCEASVLALQFAGDLLRWSRDDDDDEDEKAAITLWSFLQNHTLLLKP